jgi:hypothetical protein
MRLGPRCLALAIAALALPGTHRALPLDAQEPARVEEIRLDPSAHVNQVRVVVGVVERLVSRDDGGTPAFYLEDDFGHQVLVLPLGEVPARGSRVSVTGFVTLDRAGDPVVTVFDEDGIAPAGDDEEQASATAPSPSAPLEADEPGPTIDWGMGLFALGGVLLGVGLLKVLRLGKRTPVGTSPSAVEEGGEDPVLPVADLWPPSSDYFAGRTMRFIRPDPRVKMMPARLEVTGGLDAGEVIRFMGMDDAPIAMTFGREPGEGPFCVQLEQLTVSRKHAVVHYRHGEWLIENLSMTNPTILNGEPLGMTERLLTEGDRIEMGEVTFTFRES